MLLSATTALAIREHKGQLALLNDICTVEVQINDLILTAGIALQPRHDGSRRALANDDAK